MLTSVARAPAPSATIDPLPAPAASEDWLPTITQHDAALLSALHRHRRPIDVLFAGHKLSVATVGRTSSQLDSCTFQTALFGRPARLRLSTSLVDVFAQSLSIPGFDRLGPRQAGMVLELALLAPIKALEARLRTEIRIEHRVETPASTDAFVSLPFCVHGLPSGDAGVELLLDRRVVPAVASALDDLATPNSHTEQLPIPIAINAGHADLTVADLRTLRPGDVILADGDSTQADGAVAIVGTQLRFRAERIASGFRIASRLAAEGDNSAGVWFMQQPNEALQRPDLEEADLEQLPIRVVFEVGRLELPLAEVRRLAPGYVLPLARPSDTAVDIVANGRKIGHGSLLKVGDSIGVRVERLFSDD
jgi:type III secretion protein Q